MARSFALCLLVLASSLCVASAAHFPYFSERRLHALEPVLPECAAEQRACNEHPDCDKCIVAYNHVPGPDKFFQCAPLEEWFSAITFRDPECAIVPDTLLGDVFFCRFDVFAHRAGLDCDPVPPAVEDVTAAPSADPAATLEPTEIIETEEPTVVVETEEPTEPIETVEPTDPVLATDEPTEPIETEEPTLVVETEEPTEPIATEEPTLLETEEPTEPIETEEPTLVVETEEPTEPIETEEPTLLETEEPTEPIETEEPTLVAETPEPTEIEVEATTAAPVRKLAHSA